MRALTAFSGRLPRLAKPRVGLQRIDDLKEIVETDDTLELEAGAVVTDPDGIRFNPSDYRKPDNNAVAAGEIMCVVNHEAMSGQVADVQVHVAMLVMFRNDRKIDRMTRRTPHIRYC